MLNNGKIVDTLYCPKLRLDNLRCVISPLGRAPGACNRLATAAINADFKYWTAGLRRLLA